MHKLQLQLNYKNGGSKNHKKIANLCGLRSNIVGGGKHSKNSREFIWQVHEANLRQQCGRIRNICKPIRKYFCIWKRCKQIQSANILGNSKAHSHAYFIGLHMNIPRLIHSHPLPYLPYVIANLNTKICGTQPTTTSALHITLSRISNQIGPMGWHTARNSQLAKADHKQRWQAASAAARGYIKFDKI